MELKLFKERKVYKRKIAAILLSTLLTSGIIFSGTKVNAASGGWQLKGGKWSYINSNGTKQTGWAYVGGNWYYLGDNGDMKTGWIFLDEKWYYLNPNGDMAVGWKVLEDKWYYLKTSGEMAARAWINYNGKSYYLNSNGEMAVNTITPDGYSVGADGAWDGQEKHNSNSIYNFNMKDSNGQNFTVKIFSYDNVIAKASFNPSNDWAFVWAGASEGERLSRGHYKLSVSKQGENNGEIYEVDNNEEITLNLDRKLIRVHKNTQEGQPDFLIMGTPVCSNDSEMKVYYIKDGKLKLANFIADGKNIGAIYAFNSANIFFKQKENNIFEISSYNNADRIGFYIYSYKFNLATGEFVYINNRFMDRDEYYNYAD